MPSTVKTLQLILASVLVLSGLAKLTSPHDPTYLLGPLTYYGAAGAELGLAILIATRFLPWACLATAVIAAGGVIAGWVQDRPCGCLGSLALTPKEHQLFAALVGACAVGLLLAVSAPKTAR